jgi:RNA polymerase sigma-70 factor (ECF subfamily)
MITERRHCPFGKVGEGGAARRSSKVAKSDRHRHPWELRAMTDREMLERFVRTNDSDAFRVLVERHGPMVLALCRTVLRQPHDAEDAFQNTFLALARHASAIRNRESIAPWLHRVALRVARGARRRESRNRAVERTRSATDHLGPSQPRDLSFVPVVREEVNRLPERYRKLVVLCYLDGRTNREAAAQLKCPVGTVKGQLSRARQTLRDRMRRRGLAI